MTFFVGDDRGQIKRLGCTGDKDGTFKLASIAEHGVGGDSNRNRAIQRMSVMGEMLAVARADGSTSTYSITSQTEIVPVNEWKETRFRVADQHHQVGLGMTETGIYSCTSAGHLRRSRLPGSSESTLEAQIAYLPTRLQDFKLSPDGEKFVYGGDEVDISVWDVETAFAGAAKKKEAGDSRKPSKFALFPGETWRAKNVENDHLNLRQPVHVKSVAFLSDSGMVASGTYNGTIRIYAGRGAMRRPVHSWQDVLPAGQGGIQMICKGLEEHELFFSSTTSVLSALDLRNGKVLYTFKGMGGAVTSVAQSPACLLSTSMDRMVRVHSTVPPPEDKDAPVDSKFKTFTMDKMFWKTTPTFVCWDGTDLPAEEVQSDEGEGEDEGEDAELWEGMEAASSSEEGESGERKAKRRKH